MADEMLIDYTAMIVAAHVENNVVSVNDMPGLIKATYDALAGLNQPVAEAPAAKVEPAVTVRASLKPDALICLDCGKKFKTIKRHIGVDHGMTPDQYRAKWGLPATYPMVAPAYAETRSTLAKSLGLGRKAAVKPAPKSKKGD